MSAGSDPVEPPACKGKRCKRLLPQGWKLLFCARCHALNVKRGLNIKRAKMFPGVDIDSIHYKFGAVRKKTV